MTAPLLHPRQALFGAGDAVRTLPVCDHYAGVPARMHKSLALQAQLGPVFDVTLDCEDGAAVGAEAQHARLVGELIASAENRFGRVGARVHPVDHPAFGQDVDTIIGLAGSRLAYLMVPKVGGLADVKTACDAIDAAIGLNGCAPFPVHVLVETHGALHEVFDIAAHPRVESISFGLMDFVSAHRGAIPSAGMSVRGQFEHPLVVRAKLEIAAACHARGKTPSHCVVTEFTDLVALSEAARKASQTLGYTRMWSIHPDQIHTIVAAFAPPAEEVTLAGEILLTAQAAAWAPIRHRNTLHDRASYRYFWHVLERAHGTAAASGRPLPPAVAQAFFQETSP